MKQTMLVNDFHNTQTTVRADVNDTVSLRTANRVYNALCGVSGCTCEGIRGGAYTLMPTDGHSDRYQVVRRFSD